MSLLTPSCPATCSNDNMMSARSMNGSSVSSMPSVFLAAQNNRRRMASATAWNWLLAPSFSDARFT
jgi:hypothetical protein